MNRIFFLQLRILGSTMGSREELVRLTRFMLATGTRPEIAEVLPLAQARRGFERMIDGDLVGKIVFTGV